MKRFRSRLARWLVLFSVIVVINTTRLRAEEAEESDAEVERLEQLAKEEKDPDKERKLQDELWELRQQHRLAALPALREHWRQESDPAKRRELGEELVELGICVSHADVLLEVATEAQMPQKEIKVGGGANAKGLRLHVLKTFEPEPYPFSDHAEWVIRRMTRDRLELWLPHHGWLFDAKGRVLNVAHPPRRDGIGRQWYGAFVPDGRWVTTDIWNYDRTLHFFTRAGKWRKDIAADTLVPQKSDEDRWEASIIGWCRCDREGRGYVLSVGTNGGRGDAWVSADGSEHRELSEKESPWKMCYRRDLEPKGMYTALTTPNDTGDQTIGYTVPGHGMECGYPTYRWGDDDSISVQFLGPGAFGFWPRSNDVYIETVLPKPPLPNEEFEDPPITVFYKANGAFSGWIRATRISDTAHGDGMLFHDELDRVITLAPDMAVKKVERFVWADGIAAPPHKLFPDLRLGFFTSGKKLVLARW